MNAIVWIAIPLEELTQHWPTIRNTKSIHQNLIEAHEDEERDRMLDHLERKEAMEEKMVNTMQMVRKFAELGDPVPLIQSYLFSY